MYLKPGDTIGIVSPARWIDEEGLAPGIACLQEFGFKVLVGDHAYDQFHQFAGRDKDKISDIQKMVDDPGIAAVLASRGGYGAARIIDQLDFSSLKQNFKWLCGYSDFTVFHNHLNGLKLPTIHSTMPINMRGEHLGELDSNKSLIAALMGEDLEYLLNDHALNIEGTGEGELVGGNLSILYSTMGSPSEIQTEGKILFIEDLDEYLYHVDRMMVNLKRSGKLSGLKGLIVGGMSDMNDNTIPYGKTAEEIIHEHCAEFGYPIYFGFQAGHVQPNLALRLGMEARIKDNKLFLPS